MTTDLVKTILTCFGLGAFALWYSFKKLRVKRLIEDTPTSKSRSAAQGFAEFQGFAWPLGSVVKCSLQQDCLYYQISLQKRVKRGKNSTWETLFSRSLKEDFLLLDQTGAVQISIPHANFDVESRTVSWSDLSEESKSHLLKNNLNHFVGSGFPPGSGILGSLFGGSFRIKEQSILLGSPLIVLGEFEGNDSRSQTAPLTPGVLGFFEKIKSDPRLKIGTSSVFFDFDLNGKVSIEELRRGLHHLARAQINSSNSQVQPQNEVIPMHGVVKASDNHELLIIDHHQHTLAESSSTRFYFLFLGGVALILFGIFILLNPAVITKSF